jgi:hypothetical protein
MNARRVEPVQEEDHKARHDALAQRISQMEGIVRDLRRQLEARNDEAARQTSRELRYAFRDSQRSDLAVYESAYIEVHPDKQLTLDVLRSPSTKRWMVDARQGFARLLYKWRPDITATELAVLWNRHSSAILHMRHNAVPNRTIETAWLNALAAKGHPLDAAE